VPELPEIHCLAEQMNHVLPGKTIAAVSVRQPKCLNLPVPEFTRVLVKRRVGPVTSRGKWVFVSLRPEAHFLLNLGMGGEVRYHAPGESLPEKWQVALSFADKSSLSLAFWWFGYAHAVPGGALASHHMTASLGLDPLNDGEFTYPRFSDLLRGRKGAVKSLLLDQTKIAGIGNVYIQDILFHAGLHPHRRIPEITEPERKRLFAALRKDLRAAIRLGGLEYERDLYGRRGRLKDFLVGYREGSPCPTCGTTVEKIKTGSTASYICPHCQT